MNLVARRQLVDQLNELSDLRNANEEFIDIRTFVEDWTPKPIDLWIKTVGLLIVDPLSKRAICKTEKDVSMMIFG
jgi:hypothetical protein